jgi:hypothetical protein
LYCCFAKLRIVKWYLKSDRISLPEVRRRNNETSILWQDGRGSRVLVAGGDAVGSHALVVHVEAAENWMSFEYKVTLCFPDFKI